MRITYAPGEWNVILRSGTLVVLPPDTRHTITTGIWEALAESRNLEVALRAVTKAFDADLTSMPPFAIASLQRRLHVMVRGQITIRSRSGDAETEISGAHVTTWNEQVLDDTDALDIGFSGTASLDGQLPLEAGVVRTSGLAVSFAGSAAGSGAVAVPGADQPSWGSGGDQTMNPMDLDGFEEDEGQGDAEPAQTGQPADLDQSAATGDGPSGGSAYSTAESDTGLIASVPWVRRRLDSPPESPDSAAPDDTMRTQAPDEDVDHDGQTVMRSAVDLPPDSGTSYDHADAAGTRGPSTAPMVLARICPSGHANPPTNSNCSTCGSAITSDPTQTRRPSLGSMRMSNGEVVDLDRSVIVGRQPSMSRVQGDVMPRMVQVRGEQGDISRSHAEVQLDGWHVMLRDLNSTNGTFLIREGQPPRRLAQGEQTMLLDGDIAQLGDDVWLRFEDLK